MKKYLLVISLLFVSNLTISQILISLLLGDKLNSEKLEFGMEGGINWASIKNLENSKPLKTFNLGFYFDLKLKDPSWMIHTGVIVKSSMGADDLAVYTLGNANLDSSFRGGAVTRKIKYFNVPALIKYKFKSNIFVQAGFQVGLRYNAYDEFINSINNDKDLRYTVKVKDDYHLIDAGLSAGLGYRLMKGNGINIGIQYYYGLVDIVIDDSSPKQYNRALYLTAGIPIGKKPKTKDVTETP